MQKSGMLDRAFWILYFLLVLLFFTKPLVVNWDPAEYLAQGKFIFGGRGYASWYRPPVWPLVLGIFWKTGFPMLFTMKALATLIYLSIPLVAYFKFRGALQLDGRAFIGLVIATQPIFFQYSHAPLSHMIATLFLVLSFATEGIASGMFSALAGLSRFTFFLWAPFSLFYKNPKKKIEGMALVVIPFVLATTLILGSPFLAFSDAGAVINHPDFIWFWQESPLFYFKKLLLFSPFMLLALFGRRPSKWAFGLALAYFTFLPHKEERFIIDIIVYGAIALSENFRKLPLILVAFHLFFLPFTAPLYQPPLTIYEQIPNGVNVIGMSPEVNLVRDVNFTDWFYPSKPFTFSGMNYCIYSQSATPCKTDDIACNSIVNDFMAQCGNWNIIAREDGFIVARRPEQI